MPRTIKKVVSALCATAILAGCGGQVPNPVSVYQPGDEKRSCDGLKYEVSQNEVEIAKMLPDEDASGKNAVLGVTGLFIIVPWFFMDFKDGERIDIEALRRRNMWLREVAAKNDCTLPPAAVVFEKKPGADDANTKTKTDF